MRIAVVGIGYVGISNLLLFSNNNNVIALDNNIDRVKQLNNGLIDSLEDSITKELDKNRKRWNATNNYKETYELAEYIFLCLPTDYNKKSKGLYTDILDNEIKKINQINDKAIIVIKSTVPIGYTKNISLEYSNPIVYCPEFIREGDIYRDSLYPSRLVVGGEEKYRHKVAKMLLQCIKNSENLPIIETGYSEAEAIKLFSNAYLSMRVSYFNELDIYAENNNLDCKKIIEGVCADSRIGNFYNNPSFGYGGYCLPKDTRQLENEFGMLKHFLISSISRSNEARIEYIFNKILSFNVHKIGIYRLVMKMDADNFREATIIKIMEMLISSGKELVIYEPLLDEKEYKNVKVFNEFDKFAQQSDLIIANRVSDELKKYKDKVYSRDIFQNN